MKKIKLLLALAVILVITGCGGGKKYPITSTEIYTGTDGLTAEFFNVKDGVFEEDSFMVNVDLQNKGTYPASDDEKVNFKGYLALGIEDNYMGLERDGWNKEEWIDGKLIEIIKGTNNKKARFGLGGKTVGNKIGGRGIISINVKAKKIEEKQSEKHDTDVMMTVCYGYQTKAGPTVCIDTVEYSSKEREKSCVIEDVNLDSQGAPIAVTKVETEMLPQGTDRVKPMFLIYIANKGNGEAIGTKQYIEEGDRLEDNEGIIEKTCSEKPLTHDEFNRVYITAKLKIDNEEKELSCSPQKGLVRLKENKAMVRCVLEDGISREKGTYTSPLQITLDYGYMFTISKKVTVKKKLEY